MKITRLLALLCVFCLVFAGCQSTSSAAPETTPTGLINREPVPLPTVTAHDFVEFKNPGQLRIPYTESVSTVRYITSVDQLPDDEAFKAYDEAFFQNNALILVTQSVATGSARLTIDEISVDNGVATVKISQSVSGDVATSDMAAWLLWAEVPAGLALEWKTDSANAAQIGGLDLRTE